MHKFTLVTILGENQKQQFCNIAHMSPLLRWYIRHLSLCLLETTQNFGPCMCDYRFRSAKSNSLQAHSEELQQDAAANHPAI